MDNVTKTIKELFRRAAPTLSQSEVRSMREMLAEQIDLQPVSAEHTERLYTANRSRGEKRTVFALFLTYIRPMPAVALVLALVLSGSVSVAAQQALPGDTLYPIKTNVNEEVADWFSVSATADANRAAMLAERRLEEAEQLAVQGRLEATTRVQTQQALGVHLERFESEVAQLEVDAAGEARARLESALAAHDRVLVALESRANGDISLLRANVQTAIRQSAQAGGGIALMSGRTESDDRAGVSMMAAQETDRNAAQGSTHESSQEIQQGDGSRTSAASETGMRASAQGKIGAAENVIASAEKTLEKVSHLSAEARAEMRAQIDAAEEALIRARAEFEAEVYGEAGRLAEYALRTANEARTYLSVSEKLEIDLSVGGVIRNGNASTSINRGDSRDVRHAGMGTSTGAGEGEGGVESEGEVETKEEANGEAAAGEQGSDGQGLEVNVGTSLEAEAGVQL
ncbi:MAG: DUF5667 domain-containing protein [Candidatus Paceibacterota bacterium]